MGRFLGLRGTSLNLAIGIIAGLDFLYVNWRFLILRVQIQLTELQAFRL